MHLHIKFYVRVQCTYYVSHILYAWLWIIYWHTWVYTVCCIIYNIINNGNRWILCGCSTRVLHPQVYNLRAQCAWMESVNVCILCKYLWILSMRMLCKRICCVRVCEAPAWDLFISIFMHIQSCRIYIRTIARKIS